MLKRIPDYEVFLRKIQFPKTIACQFTTQFKTSNYVCQVKSVVRKAESRPKKLVVQLPDPAFSAIWSSKRAIYLDLRFIACMGILTFSIPLSISFRRKSGISACLMSKTAR